MSVAPQAVLSPWRAAGLPSTIRVESPLTIGLGPCFGHVVLSPMRAIALPPVSLWEEASMTEPPWDVLSPSVINGPAMIFLMM